MIINVYIKKTLFAIGLLAIAITTWANGDPVVEHSALTLSRTPVSRQIPEIQITYELLDITPSGKYTHFSVRYRFHNTSAESFPEIHYGFPIDWYGKSDSIEYTFRDHWTESLREIGWRDDYVTDVVFTLDGQSLDWQCSPDTILHEAHSLTDLHLDEDKLEDWVLANDGFDYENRLNRRWYYTVFSIPAHATVELNVQYNLANKYNTSLYGEGLVLKDAIDCWFGEYVYANNHQILFYNFSYDFSPAAAWGNGMADSIDVFIHTQSIIHKSESLWPDYWERRNYIAGLKPDTLPDGNLHFSASNFDYATTEPLFFAFEAKSLEKEDVDYILSHRLSGDKYTVTIDNMLGDSISLLALSDMDFSTATAIPFSGDTTIIHIHLPEPQYVTSMLLFNGCCMDSANWMASSKVSQMLVCAKSFKTNELKLCFGKSKGIDKTPVNRRWPFVGTNNRLVLPHEFTWEGVIATADKMNVNQQQDFIYIHPDGTRHEWSDESWQNGLISDLYILVTGVTSLADMFMLSEIMLTTCAYNESVFGQSVIVESDIDPIPYTPPKF